MNTKNRVDNLFKRTKKYMNSEQIQGINKYMRQISKKERAELVSELKESFQETIKKILKKINE